MKLIRIKAHDCTHSEVAIVLIELSTAQGNIGGFALLSDGCREIETFYQVNVVWCKNPHLHEINCTVEVLQAFH